MKQKEVIFLESIEILSLRFTIKWHKQDNGGSVDFRNNIIRIGIRGYKEDSARTINIISHEIMEAILILMGGHFNNGRDDNFLFNFNHQTFENAIQIHTNILMQFIK